MQFVNINFHLVFTSQDKVTDIHVICGVLKDFLRKIEEPIITFQLHEQFMNAAGKLQCI